MQNSANKKAMIHRRRSFSSTFVRYFICSRDAVNFTFKCEKFCLATAMNNTI